METAEDRSPSTTVPKRRLSSAGESTADVAWQGPGDRNRERRVSRTPVMPPTRGRRRPWLILTGTFLIVAGGALAAWQVDAAAQRVPVLVAARAVAVGSTITDADVTQADISVDPRLATIPAERRDLVVGKVATTQWVPGSVLAPGQMADAMPPARGQVLVVLALPSTRMPIGGLKPGDSVLVVSTPSAQTDPTITEPATVSATVVRVAATDPSGVTAVDVTVATAEGPRLAARAATGRIAVVIQPHGR